MLWSLGIREPLNESHFSTIRHHTITVIAYMECTQSNGQGWHQRYCFWKGIKAILIYDIPVISWS